MIEGVMAFFAGVFGQSVSGHLGRRGYLQVIVIGVALGLALDIAAVLIKVVELGGVADYFEWEVSKIDRFGISNTVVAYSALPVICSVTLVFVRSLSRVPSWKEAEQILLKDGYDREVSADGRRVVFTKDRNKFIARSSGWSGPSKLEWWRDGKRKGDILLNTH